MMKSPQSKASPPPQFRSLAAVLFLLSAAALLFEINLSRLFSVAQFYHFAFMIVSIALLGYGASGTALAVFPRIAKRDVRSSLRVLSFAAGAGMLASYLLTNFLPFDSFSIAWDGRQARILVLHYLALSAPFFFSGMAAGLLLTAFPSSSGRVYAVNLLGSAAGCLAALAAPAFLGGEGVVTLSAGLAALAAFAARTPEEKRAPSKPAFASVLAAATVLLAAFCFADDALRILGCGGFGFLEIRLSPYKSLSCALQQPGAEILFRRWNAFSRVDVIRSGGIHSLPGLSYRWLGPLPPQDGLTVDGDNLAPVVDPSADLSFTEFLPSAPALSLRPQAEILVLEARGGLDVLAALQAGAARVTAVEGNPLTARAAGDIFTGPRVETVLESGRSYLRRTTRRFDLILLSLTDAYHPVRSGAYSLAEDYRYTVEAFGDGLAHLNEGGMLVVTRWLQQPPSEALRAFALAVTALENAGMNPRAQAAAWRGYNTATILMKESPFTGEELGLLRASAARLAFDLVYLPGIREEEANRFNILPEPVYYQAFTGLLEAQPREDFYAAYPFDVSPPADDHPFFGHFFKWSQASRVAAEFGKVWQPFGGAGYFVVLALLFLAVLLSAALIVLPVILRRREDASPFSGLLYFGLIGFGFLLVEVPLIQRFILFLDQPAPAMTAVLFSLLASSGLGSLCSGRIPLRGSLGALAALLFAAPFLLPAFESSALGLPLPARFLLAALVPAPAGFLMGTAFPGGIRRVLARGGSPEGIPWIWTVNGAASVVAAVLAALVGLTFGFSRVFLLGAVCYCGAWFVVMVDGFRKKKRRCVEQDDSRHSRVF